MMRVLALSGRYDAAYYDALGLKRWWMWFFCGFSFAYNAVV